MTAQLALELSPRSRSHDPSTSVAAAGRVSEFASAHFDRILSALDRPRTIAEIADATGLDPVQVARRMPEMQRANLVAVAQSYGHDVTRPGPSGRPQRVWGKA